MLIIDPATLDKIDNFRAQSISQIKSLEFSPSIVLFLRKRMNELIDDLTSECILRSDVGDSIVVEKESL